MRDAFFLWVFMFGFLAVFGCLGLALGLASDGIRCKHKWLAFVGLILASLPFTLLTGWAFETHELEMEKPKASVELKK